MAHQQRNNAVGEERVFDGYSYLVHERRNNKIYLRCRHYQTRFCQGRGNIVGGVFIITNIHNHAPVADLQIIRKFRKNLRQACETQFRSPREIYNSLSPIYPDAALIVTWEIIHRTMIRWQLNRSFPNAPSLVQLMDILSQPMYQQLMIHETSEMSVKLVRPNGVDQIFGVVITDTQLPARIVSNNSPIFISIHRLNVPLGMDIFENLAIIVPHQNHSFSVGWSFISNTNENTYSTIIGKMMEEIGENFNPPKIIFNFNNRIFQYLRGAFTTETIVRGSFSSHCHIILQQAVLMNIEFNHDNLVIIQKLIALSLLPPERIYEAFISLRSAIPGNMEQLKQIFQYYDNYWIINIGPENYSFYSDEEALFNSEDAQWEMIESMIHNRDRTIWDYLKTFFTVTQRSHSTLNQIANEDRRSINKIPRVRYVIHRPSILRLWHLIENNRINISHFLAACTGLLESFINDLIFKGIYPDADFEIVRYDNIHNQLIPEFEVEPIAILAELHVNGLPRRQEVLNNILWRNRLVEEGRFVTDDGRCIGCVGNVVQTEFLPCRHCVLCERCTEELRETATRDGLPLRCPICRADPVEVRRIE